MHDDGHSPALQNTVNGTRTYPQSSSHSHSHSLPSLYADSHGLPMLPNLSKANDMNSDSGVMYKIAAPPPGFTAVNGGTPRYTSFRVDDSVRPGPNGSYAPASEPPPPSHLTHSWRPQDDAAAIPSVHDGHRTDTPNTNKRKREESDATATDARPQQFHQAEPRKGISSRTTPPPENASNRELEHKPAQETAPLAYGRAPSPVYRKDRGAPPPRAGPEISAALAESLQRSLEAADQLPQRQNKSIDRSASPEEGSSYDRQTSQLNDDENEINLDGTKKRKRNFTHRTKTGCHTCRQRKKKCDETKPICMNCQRGTFECGGYGPKPPGGAKLSARQNTPIKPYEPSHGPTQFVYSVPPTATYEELRRYVHPPADYPTNNQAPPAPPSEPPRSEPPRTEPPRTEPAQIQHFSRPSYPTEPHPPPSRMSYGPPPPSRDSYGPPPPSRETYPRTYPDPPPPPNYAAERGLPPPIDHAGLAPLQIYPPHNLSPPLTSHWDRSHYRHSSHHTAPPPPPPPPPPASTSHHAPTPRSHYSSSLSDNSLKSLTANVPHRRPGLTLLPDGSKAARSKLMTGEAVPYFIDDSLLRDRISCKRALESYNDACTARSMASPGEQSRLFSTVLNPAARSNEMWSSSGRWDGPQGSSGRRSVVLAPFRCEFGYNVHLGDNVIVDVGCYFQDAAEIWLGNGVVVGADCKFFTLDLKSGRKGAGTIGGGVAAEGSQGFFRAGAIRLEDDCMVEGNVTILPFRTIGKGARVVAGSVVTKDVKPGSVVAGNPAKEVRGEDDRIVDEENARMIADMQNGWRGKGFGEG